MRLRQINFYLLQIQLCMPIKHNLAERSYTENLVVEVITDAGVVGFGEGIPREYVTGETVETSLGFLQDYLIPRLDGLLLSGPADLAETLTGLATFERRTQAPAACCALELAILDAAGKSWGRSLADLLGGAEHPLLYSAIVPMMNGFSFERFLSRIRDLNMSQVKIKVGTQRDLESIALTRQILGEKVDLRVDANGAWSAEEAVRRIKAMMAYDISAVEQPVAKTDTQGLKQVAERVPIPVIADESLCGEQDANYLATNGACQVFNLRLSKCGGIFSTARIYDIAQRRGITAQLGCQVGETGILSAAGRHFASRRKLLYLEGSYSNYLLEQDIVDEALDFGPGGIAQPLAGFGLGVKVNQDTLHRLALRHQEIRL
jgi:muconate cycloisomerase